MGLGQRAVAENWLAKGARPKSRNLHGHPAVTLAARSGELAVLAWLHEHLGLSVRARSDDGRSVAAIAAWHGHLHVVQYVFEADRQATEVAAAAAARGARSVTATAGEPAEVVDNEDVADKEGEEEKEGLVVKRNAAEITKTPVRVSGAAARPPPLSPPSVVNPGLDCDNSNAVPSVPASLTNHHQNSARALFTREGEVARDKPMGKRARWRLRHRLSQTHDYQGEEPAILPPSPEKYAQSRATSTAEATSPTRSLSTTNIEGACRKLVLAPSLPPDQMEEKKTATSSRHTDTGVPEIGCDEPNSADEVPDNSSLGDDALFDDGIAYNAADSSGNSIMNGEIAGSASSNSDFTAKVRSTSEKEPEQDEEQDHEGGGGGGEDEEAATAAAAAKSQAALAKAMHELEAARALDWDAVAAVARSRGETRILKWLQLASKTKTC